MAGRVWAVATRELSSMFRLPLGWVVIALFSGLTAVVFVSGTLSPGAPATMRYFFAGAGWMMLPIAPAVSMRLLSEELRSGSAELLLAGPVSDGEIVWGKYLGGAMFLGLMLAPSLALPLSLWALAEPAPDPGPVLAGYLTLSLVGLLYLAVGTLASAMTSSQTLAFLGAMIALVTMMTLSGVVASSGVAPEWVSRALVGLSVSGRVRDMVRGVIDTGSVVFFLGVSFWFVYSAGLTLRWRRSA